MNKALAQLEKELLLITKIEDWDTSALQEPWKDLSTKNYAVAELESQNGRKIKDTMQQKERASSPPPESIGNF